MPGLGVRHFRGASIGLERRLASYYKRPTRANHRLFVNELLAGTITPKLSSAQVDALPERTRAALRSGVVQACDLERSTRALRGSSLSPDERLFAAMLWHYEEWTARMGELMVGFSFAAMNDLGKAVSSLQPHLRQLSTNASTLASNILRNAGLSERLGQLFKRHSYVGHQSLNGSRLALPTRDLAARFVAPSVSLVDVNALRPKLVDVADVMRHQRPLQDAIAKARWNNPLEGFLRERYGDLGRFMEQLRDVARELEDEAEVLRRWESSALWFLLSLMSVRAVRPLLDMDGDALETTVLDALEGAVRDAGFGQELVAAVSRCETLTTSQRHHLLHGLDHARRGEWLDASPPLLDGLEGAFWSAAREQNVINSDRYLVEQPTKLIKGVDALFKRLPLPGEYATFLRRRVFGTTGNAFRHGDAEGGERRQVLFGVAALAGWLEEFADEPVRYALGSKLQLHIGARAALPRSAAA